MHALSGIHSALVTPFGDDGALAVDVLPGLVRFQLQQGIDGF